MLIDSLATYPRRYKVREVPVQIMHLCGGVKFQVHSFLTSALGEVNQIKV
jgi:hypothetical protein